MYGGAIENLSSTSCNDSQTRSQLPKPFQKSISASENLVNVFEKVREHVQNAIVDKEPDEPLPPGFEETAASYPSCICKYHPSRSDEHILKIGEYILMAICRQKLHDDVLREWKSFIIDEFLHQFFLSKCDSRRRRENGSEVTFYLIS